MNGRYDKIPPAVLAALTRYKDFHVNPGSFVRAVITNDLITSVQRADSKSLKALPQIAAWAFTELPNEAWGSCEKFAAWAENPIAPINECEEKESNA